MGEQPYRFNANTRTEKENAYQEERELVMSIDELSNVEQVDNFPIYISRQAYAKYIARQKLFEMVLDVQGSVVECGVLYGGGLMQWAQLSSIFEPVNAQRRIIGFDTFDGLTELAEREKNATASQAHEGGFNVDSYRLIDRAVELYDKNRPIGHIPKVFMVRGDATKTIPQFVKEHPYLVISLLYLDFDILEPTSTALEHFVDCMPKGAVIVFDQLNSRSWPGESIALKDRINLNNLKIRRFPFTSTLSYAVIGE